MTTTILLDSALGGDGNTYTDGVGDNSATRGMDGGNHAQWFMPLVTAIMGVANYCLGRATAAAASATTAAAAAATALAAPGTMANSITSLTIGTGSKTFTLTAAGKLFAEGQRIVAASAADPTKQMSGIVTTAPGVGSTLTALMDYTSGAGTLSDWVISLGAQSGVSSVAGLGGGISAAGLKSALGIAVADVTDFTTNQAAQDLASSARAIAFAIAL